MDAASKAGVPIAVIRHHRSDAEYPDFGLNSEAWKPAMETRPRSLIEKQLPGSFTGTNLEW